MNELCSEHLSVRCKMHTVKCTVQISTQNAEQSFGQFGQMVECSFKQFWVRVQLQSLKFQKVHAQLFSLRKFFQDYYYYYYYHYYFYDIVLFLISILNQDKLQMEPLMIFLQDYILIFFQLNFGISIRQLSLLLHIFSCSLSLFFVMYELKQFKQ